MFRRKAFIVQMLLIFCLFPLSACSAESDSALETLEGFYNTLENFSARVRAQVELSDRVQEYVLDWEYSYGAYRVSIVEPEALAGISVIGSEADGLIFEYDTITLTVDASGSVISPLEALCEILSDWRGNVPDEYCFEQCQNQNALAVNFSHTYGGALFSQRTWFDPNTCAPLYTEVFSDGAMVTTFEFLLFQLH